MELINIIYCGQNRAVTSAVSSILISCCWHGNSGIYLPWSASLAASATSIRPRACNSKFFTLRACYHRLFFYPF